MDTTKDLLVSYLIDSLMLSAPLISQDPAFAQLQEDIPKIVEQSAKRLGKTVEEIIPDEEYIVILYAKLEIFQRLALAVAPEFDVTVEQASFKKGNRFFHYTALAQEVQTELETNASIYTVIVKPVTVATKDGTIRNYNLSREQPVKLSIDLVSDNSIELSWNKFDLSYGNFKRYSLYYGLEPMYDEYADTVLDISKALTTQMFYDINRTKYRLNNLSANTTYYIVLVFEGRNGAKSLISQEVMTNG